MLSNNQIKLLRALHRRKFRQKYDKFMVEGEKIALEILRHPNWPLEQIFATESWIETHQQELYAHLKKTITVTPQELKQVSALSTPSPVLMVSRLPHYQSVTTDFAAGLTLFLDQIQDPGNLGTILRIADWFGLPQVCLSPGCVDVYNPKTLQASMGAFLRVKTIQHSLDELCSLAGSIPVLGADMQGENVFTMDKPSSAILVIGNEGQGISPAVRSQIQQWVHIPAKNAAGAESLNAAVAAGILVATFCNA